MEQLQRLAASYLLAAGGGHGVAALEATEEQFLVVRLAGGRLHERRQVVVIPLRHVEQRVGRFGQVRQDERRQTALERQAPHETGLHVGADTLLAALEHDHANLAGPGQLLLDPLVHIHLRGVELERRYLAFLRQHLEARLRVVREFRFQSAQLLAALGCQRGHSSSRKSS
jgi:hypothetical protein